MASDTFLLSYLPILIFMVIAAFISVAAIAGSLLMGKQNPDPEKISAYECGFDAFMDTHSKFDVRFYNLSRNVYNYGYEVLCVLGLVFVNKSRPARHRREQQTVVNQVHLRRKVRRRRGRGRAGLALISRVG